MDTVREGKAAQWSVVVLLSTYLLGTALGTLPLPLDFDVLVRVVGALTLVGFTAALVLLLPLARLVSPALAWAGAALVAATALVQATALVADDVMVRALDLALRAVLGGWFVWIGVAGWRAGWWGGVPAAFAVAGGLGYASTLLGVVLDAADDLERVALLGLVGFVLSWGVAAWAWLAGAALLRRPPSRPVP